MFPQIVLMGILGACIMALSPDGNICYFVNYSLYGCNNFSLTETNTSRCTEIHMGGYTSQRIKVIGKDTSNTSASQTLTTSPMTLSKDVSSESTSTATHEVSTFLETETTFETTVTATQDGKTTSTESGTTFESTVTDDNTAPSTTNKVTSTHTTEPDFTSDQSTETVCPSNMVVSNCTCLRTCQDPQTCSFQCNSPSICQCPAVFFMNGSNCVFEEECGCYLDGYVLPNGTSSLNHNCTTKCSCNDGRLFCEEFGCGVQGSCKAAYNRGKCVCEYGFSEDGETCVQLSDCYDALKAGFTQDGVYSIYPTDWPSDPFDVYCQISRGGWTVFQRNELSNTSFKSSWKEYKDGFGDIQDVHWLGNEKLYYLTNQNTYTLNLEITTATGTTLYAKYSDFKINSERERYKITSVGDYFGDAGNGLLSSFGYSFSTKDADNDGLSTENCAASHGGGWWYGSNFHISSVQVCNSYIGNNNVYYSCGVTNLNGNVERVLNFIGTYYEGTPFWGSSHGENCNLYKTEMKLMPSL